MNLSKSEIKYLRSLQNKKFRNEEKKFLLEGWKPLAEALSSDWQIELIAVKKEERSRSENRSSLELAEKKHVPIKELKELELKQLADTVHSQGVIALVSQNNMVLDTRKLNNADIIVACDSINDPGNLGTILRTCDWFGVDTVLLNKGCVSLYNEKVVRSTAGSIFHLKIFENIDLEKTLSDFKSAGFKVTATAMEGRSVFTAGHKEKMILLLGSEAHGLDTALIKQADEILSIPSFGKAESLNVGIACGIILAELRK